MLCRVPQLAVLPALHHLFQPGLFLPSNYCSGDHQQPHLSEDLDQRRLNKAQQSFQCQDQAERSQFQVKSFNLISFFMDVKCLNWTKIQRNDLNEWLSKLSPKSSSHFPFVSFLLFRVSALCSAVQLKYVFYSITSSVIISRAKIKSVKLSLVIIAFYIICSTPVVVSQLLSSLKIM